MHPIHKLILLSSLILMSCATAKDPNASDARLCPVGSEFCDGKCISFDRHPDHCGSCGNVCPEGSNACVAGQCVCISNDQETWSKAPCSDPAECTGAGLCLTPDPNGEKCDPIESVYCEDGNKVCVAGFCTTPDCDHPEVCNLLDDDCDGLTDRTEPGVRLNEECYSGDPATENIGICFGGFHECVAGGWTPCDGEQLPIPEDGLLACDGVDNDCNDCVDDDYDEDGNLTCGMPDVKVTDTIFIVDVSGSMSSIITAATTAMSSLVNLYSAATWIRWGIIEVSWPEELVNLVQPLADYMNFLSSLSTLAISGGTEPTYDAVWRVAEDDFVDPSLGRDAEAQLIIVVFTDESPRGANNPSNLSETEVCNVVNATGAVLAVFTDAIHFEDWDECALTYALTTDAEQMTDQLNDLFESSCVSGSK